MAPLGRRTTDFAQKMKGNQALRFQLELIPHVLDGVPASAKQASFMWERGTKLQYTDPSPVNSDTGVVYWGNTLLKQTATVYRHGDGFKPKEYYFKIQDIIGSGQKRHTFAKCKIDLAAYCSCKADETQEVTVPVSGAGKLKIRITATWLRHSSPDNDAITEISEMSLGNNKSTTSSIQMEQASSPFKTFSPRHNIPPTRTRRTDLSGFESQQSRLHRQRMQKGLASPFGNEAERADSLQPPSEISPSKQRPGPKKSSSLSLKFTPDWRKRQSRFHDADLNTVQEEESTPRMHDPRQTNTNRAGSGNMGHNRQASTQSYQSTEVYSSRPQNGQGASPQDYNDLISSDSEGEGGIMKATKRWFKNKDQGKMTSQQDIRMQSPSASGVPSELDLMNMEDTNALRQLARQALRERDAEHFRRQQSERHARSLQADCEALTMSKSMLVERLKEAEDRLLFCVKQPDEVEAKLVRAKIKLAHSDYVNLELTGSLSREREKVMIMKQRLTDLEAAYHSTLDSLDQMNQQDRVHRGTI